MEVGDYVEVVEGDYIGFSGKVRILNPGSHWATVEIVPRGKPKEEKYHYGKLTFHIANLKVCSQSRAERLARS